MTSIEFQRTPSRVFDALGQVKPRIIGQQTATALRLAFKHGAYVAGGFARIIAVHELGTETGDDRIRRYLGVGQSIERNARLWKASKGDVDLFFPHLKALELFWADVALDPVLKGIPIHPMKSNACVELDCDKDTVVQVITSRTAPIEMMLSGFDLYNAMVAFNGEEFIEPVGWRALEEQRMVHVVNWTSPYVINRITKWFYKHHMKNLSPKTASEIGPYALEVVARLQKEPIVMPWGTMTYHSVVNKLKKFLPLLPNEELARLISTYPLTAYSGAFGVLQSRSPDHVPRQYETIE